MTNTQIEETVETIINTMFSDSHVVLDRDAVREAVQDDLESALRLPTNDEVQVLIMGDDNGGIPETLEYMFPALNALLGEQF